MQDLCLLTQSHAKSHTQSEKLTLKQANNLMLIVQDMLALTDTCIMARVPVGLLFMFHYDS